MAATRSSRVPGADARRKTKPKIIHRGRIEGGELASGLRLTDSYGRDRDSVVASE